MDYKGLGERIREERLRLHLTQAQLAEAVDISDTYMGAIERGERSLTLDTLVRLVNRLGVTVDYLLADSVSDSDANIMEQFKQIIDQQPVRILLPHRKLILFCHRLAHDFFQKAVDTSALDIGLYLPCAPLQILVKIIDPVTDHLT